MKKDCRVHELGLKEYGRDDQTVQLMCLKCKEIISVDSRDYDEDMQRMADDDLDFDNHFNDDEDDDFDYNEDFYHNEIR